MNKETQDHIWSVLTKDKRELCRNMNRTSGDGNVEFLLDVLFGYHNLTSDEEPSELLFVERRKVQERYSEYLHRIRMAVSNSESMPSRICISLLKDLFSDNCFPDEEPSVQVEPKFKVGDKVRINCRDENGEVWDSVMDGRVVTIKDWYYGIPERNIIYKLEEGIRDFGEHCLEPYTEENEETKETMEEKELNLIELLKDCPRSQKFYSPFCGNLYFEGIRCLTIDLSFDEGEHLHLESNGTYLGKGFCQVFPSRALYEKYPLDPIKAWDEWAEERKPKRWRAKENQSYWRIKGNGEISCETENRIFFDDQHYNCMNYFRTEEEAQQVAEAVRKTLEEFHSKNTVISKFYFLNFRES